MKKITAILFTLFLSPLALAANFSEGTHYTVISGKQATATPQIVEFFSFLCPSCYRFEPLVKSLKTKLPSDVSFTKSHVDFLGGNLGVALTKSYAISHVLKVDDKVTPAIFKAVHVEKRRLSGLSDIRPLFLANGVDEKRFDSAAKSFSAKGLASKMTHNMKKFQVSAVPTFVVNGKYKVVNESISSQAMFEELVIFLTKKTD